MINLHTLSETCEFADLEIEQQSIGGETSTKIRKRALRYPTFDLKSMLIEGRRDEQSIAEQIESEEPSDGKTKKSEQPRASRGVTCRNCVCLCLSARRVGVPSETKDMEVLQKTQSFCRCLSRKTQRNAAIKVISKRAKIYTNNARRNESSSCSDGLFI